MSSATSLISTVNDAVKLDIITRFTSKEQEVVKKINVMLVDVLKKNQEALNQKREPLAQMIHVKQMAALFFEETIDKDKVTSVVTLSLRIQEVTSLLITKVGFEIMQSPSRGFFGMLGAVTNPKSVTDFFTSQCVTSATLLTEELERIYTAEVIDEVVGITLNKINAPEEKKQKEN